jgi:hypothetical protein
MLYHLDFHVEYSAQMSQQDLFTIWAEEAEAALGAKKAGTHVHVEVTSLQRYEDFAKDVRDRLHNVI